MPTRPEQGQPESTPMPDADMMALLDDVELPPDAPGLRPVAEVLAALRAAASGDELAAEPAALAVFRQQAGVSSLPRRSRRRRPAMLTVALSASAAVVAAILGLGAYTGGLPGPMQRLAHDALGAPSPGHEQAVSAGPAAPTPSGGVQGTGTPGGARSHQSRLYRMCGSYEQTHGHGGGVGRSAAFHELIKDAGGAGKVTAFCARILHPGAAPSPPKKHAKPHKHGNGNSQGNGNGNGNSQGNGNGNGNGNSQGNGNGNGNGNSQGSGIPDSRWALKLAPHP